MTEARSLHYPLREYPEYAQDDNAGWFGWRGIAGLAGFIAECRAMEQFDRMDDLDLPAVRLGFGLNVHGAADVAGDADARAGGFDVLELSLGEIRRHFR